MKTTMLITLCLVLASCAGDCIKIGGTYGDKSGSFEYCFDSVKSIELGVPVLSGENGELFGITKDQAQDIKDMIENPVQAKNTAEIKKILETITKEK